MDIAEHIRTDPEEGTRRLVTELGQALYALALRLAGNQADADDLFVRTLESAVRHIAEQRGPFFFAWLTSICTNLHLSDVRRKKLPMEPDADLESVPDIRPSPCEEASVRVDAETVRIAIARIPERYRAPALLRYWAGLSHSEIASALGIPEGTARQYLFQAHVLLRAELGRSLERKTK